MMLEIDGIPMDRIPFQGLELREELVSFEDRPILLHLQDDAESDLIAYWVDYDENTTRWIYTTITKQELFDYLNGNKSLRQLFSELTSNFIFLVDNNLSADSSLIRILKSNKIPVTYLPEESSFFLEGLSPFYEQYLTKFDYMHRLREDACIINIEPPNQTHLNTVGAREAAVVLNGVSSSMEGYIKVIAFELYKNKFSDVTRINKRINQVKNRLSPRIAQTADHSFEVWLAMDIVTFHAEDGLDSELRSSIVEGYKQEVLDVDFTSEEDAKIIHEKYNDDQRKMIFDPILKILESDDFVISISDFKGTIKRKQHRVRLAPSFKKIVFPPLTVEEAIAELEKKNELVAYIFNLKEGTDITKLGKKQLMDNLIFKEEIAESPIDINSPIIIDGQTISIRKPLRCILRVDVSGKFSLTHELFELYAEGKDIEEITNSIKSQFARLIQQINDDIIPQNDPKKEAMRAYI